MGVPGTDQLDGVVSAVTQVFVLSLAVERVSALLKHMGLGFWGDHGRRQVIAKKDVNQSVPADVRRAVLSVNSLFVGMALAFATQSNALRGISGTTASGWHELAQILMTGAAAGVGSSFWYDLISLLIQVRETRKDMSAAALVTAEQIAVATPRGALELAHAVREGKKAQPTI
jgi:hypothetical protein